MELLLWSAAALCFGLVAWDRLLAIQADHASHELIAQPKVIATGPQIADQQNVASVADGEVIGRVNISALGISVPMTAGVGSGSLLRGVGHVAGTAFPGGLGTVALAGHRDTYFRPLEHIARKMDIEVVGRSGTYHYEVESWEIVNPEDVDVLSIRDKPELVLITCYPFHYIGAAPQRFIVHARLVSLTPDSHDGNVERANAHP